MAHGTPDDTLDVFGEEHTQEEPEQEEETFSIQDSPNVESDIESHKDGGILPTQGFATVRYRRDKLVKAYTSTAAMDPHLDVIRLLLLAERQRNPHDEDNNNVSSFQNTVALSAGISQPMFSLALKHVLSAFLKHLDRYISFTKCEEFAHVEAEFYGVAQIPRAVGSIDGTHVALVSPHGNGQVYQNRKNLYSLSVQVVCLVDLYISQICAWFPGSVNDASIMWNSAMPQLMKQLSPERGWLVGDSAYPGRPWLLTPVRNPTTPQEYCFNEALRRTKSVIEWAFELLKARFCCFDKPGGALLYLPAKMFQIIVACCMLHNLALRRQIPCIPDEGEVAVPPGEIADGPSEDDSDVDESGDMRADLINQYFT
ncbi:putative nuclease HARBI1 [Pleurodeles waltl]|uniref:putative nuclease HARBI1 n=1 Tax=Pleurodeles waltl TaxID=8319 RepID=UPI003709A20A